MDRINDPSAPNKTFVDADLTAGVPGTIVRALFLMGLQEELVAGLIEYAGLTPDPADLTQVRKAIQRVAPGAPAVRGLRGSNNAVAPNTRMDFSADLVVLRNPGTGGCTSVVPPGTLTNDLGVSGAGGAASAISASTWVHFYYVWGPSAGLSTTASTAAPPTGPALPSGYTHWAYIGAVYFGSGGALAQVVMRGDWCSFASPVTVVNGGSSTSWTAVSIATVAPPNAGEVRGSISNIGLSSSGAGSYAMTLFVGSVSGVAQVQGGLNGVGAANAITGVSGPGFTAPNTGSLAYSCNVAAGSGPTVIIAINGYSMPNGGG